MSRRPTLDFEQDLKGARPERLARALFCPSGPRPGGKSVGADPVAVEEVTPDEASDGTGRIVTASMTSR